MKTGAIKLDSNTVVDLAVMGIDLGIDICAKKVVKEIIHRALPTPTNTKTKIMYKVGEYAFTFAIGAIISDKLNDAGEAVKNVITTVKNIKKENLEDGSSESEAEQQQVQEG